MQFYVEGLGFEVEAITSSAHAELRLGRERIELVEWDGRWNLAPLSNGPDVRFQHAAIVTRDMVKAYRRLMRLFPVAITRGGPTQLPEIAGSVTAFKFRDPDGHPLELLSFPPGGGDARWQTCTQNSLTLGIDHFALSVGDVENSIAFYKHAFGFTVTSRQINSGSEQSCLDGLDFSVVEVVALRTGASSVPHIELLNYRQPLSQAREHAPTGGNVDCLTVTRYGTPTEPDAIANGLHTDPDGHALLCIGNGFN